MTRCSQLLRVYQTLKKCINEDSLYKVKVLKVVYYPDFSGFVVRFADFKRLGWFFSDPDRTFPLDLLDKTQTNMQRLAADRKWSYAACRILPCIKVIIIATSLSYYLELSDDRALTSWTALLSLNLSLVVVYFRLIWEQ